MTAGNTLFNLKTRLSTGVNALDGIYIRLITRASMKYDEILHEYRQYCHEPKASRNTKYE